MKHLLPFFTVLALVLFQKISVAQQGPLFDAVRPVTPSGLMDNVFDRLGNKYALADLEVGKPGAKTTSIPTSCTSGYFQMFLETGSGMEGTDPLAVARRNVLCQVLADISALIASPCSSTGQKINIWVRDPDNVGGGFLAAATAFYNMPYSATASGIQDHAIWITANSGVDAYSNTTSPLYMSSGGGGAGTSYYHGMMAFVCDGGTTWHTDLTTPPAAGEYDLYTVALHEITHALGFASLIDYNGNSRMGAGFKYFNRYDLRLVTPSGSPLITNPAPSCGMYGWTFNPALVPFTVLSPGGTSVSCPSGYQTGAFVNHTVCASAVKYVGSVTQPVYTPSCYEKGSSLSHFEDECSVPAGSPLTPPASNDHYFVMCNASLPGPYHASTNPGAMKRYLTPAERSVLCDIGYTTNTTFGSVANLNYVNYGGTSCGAHIAGINDGIGASGFTFFGVGAIPIAINGGAAGSLLSNDYGAASFKCLEVVSGSGSLSATSGSSSTVVTFTASPGVTGIQLLRYIPVSAAGVDGNITYVYVSVGDVNCTPSPCDLVNNGDFEDIISDGCDNMDISTAVRCWTPFAQTPDIYGRSAACDPMDIPNDHLFPTPLDVHPLSVTPNDHYMGMWGGKSASGYVVEASQVPLTSSLMPGVEYVVGFWAIMAHYGILLPIPSVLEMAVAPGYAPLPGYAASFMSATPASFNTVLTVNVDYPAQWHYYERRIIFSGTAPANALLLLNASYRNPSSYPATYATYIVIDDISIRPVAGSLEFDMPDTLCYSALTLNLNDRVSVHGGTFSWTKMVGGIPTVTHDTLFDPIEARAASISSAYPGSVSLSYTYTDPVGCTKTVYANTYIKPDFFDVSASVACYGGPVFLTCTGPASNNYSWSPSVTCLSPSCASAMTTLMASTTFTITETNTHCQAFFTVPVIAPSDIVGPASLCVGSVVSYVNLSPGGTWSSGNPAVATVSPSGLVTALSTGTTSLGYMNTCERLVTKIVTVNAAVSPITGDFILAPGATTVLADVTPGGTWISDNSSVAVADATTGAVSGVAAGTATITYLVSTGCLATAVVTVSSTTDVSSAGAYRSHLFVAPNPAKGIFRVSGEVGMYNGEAVIEITDVAARIVYQRKVPVKGGVFDLLINPEGYFTTGTYIIKCRTPVFQQVLRLSVIP